MVAQERGVPIFMVGPWVKQYPGMMDALWDVSAWLGFGGDNVAYTDALRSERVRIFDRATS